MLFRSTFPIGVTTVTNTATDASGNSSSCTFSVTVTDTQNPVITCPSNLVLTADAGQCSRSNVIFSVTATDNCSVTNLVSSRLSGSTFPIGLTLVTNTATDPEIVLVPVTAVAAVRVYSGETETNPTSFLEMTR